MCRLQSTLGRFRSVNKFHSPVLVPAQGAAQRRQIGQLAQQARNGRQSCVFYILQSRFQSHFVTNSERSMIFRYVATVAEPMKLSRSNSQSQGENNRETCTLGSRCRSPVPQHFSDSNGRPC